MLDKKNFREQFRTIRQKISPNKRLNAAAQARHWLIGSNLFANSDRIAAYISVNDEFDSTPLIRAIWESGKKCYLPVLVSDAAQPLAFVAYREGIVLQPNRYGIPEPAEGERVPPETLDLVLVPLVGFDRQGRRLGMGAGYYDRTFAFLHGQKPHACQLIGVGFASQQTTDLPEDPWDVPLDGVLTEEGWFFFAPHEGS